MNEPAVGPARSAGTRTTFYHPLSGVAILGIDWVFFGLGWELGPVSMAIASVAAFLSCYAVVRRVQIRLGGDDPKRARWKALIGAVAAGVPFAIGGTLLGGLILILSGLKTLPALGRRS
jgi:hypothetical protein